jgi:hypothetical protein
MNFNGVIARMQVVNDQQLYSSLAISPPRPTERQQQIWHSFVQNCQRRGIRPFPASPAACADWLNSLPEEAVEEACNTLVAIHNSVGASNPVATIACATVLSRKLRAECPRSWSNEDKQCFVLLPRETQVILTRRENERDAALRKKQNEFHNNKRVGVAAELARAIQHYNWKRRMSKFYKQNNKTVGDRWAEGLDETNILHTVEDDGYKAVRHDVVDIGTRENMFTNSNWKVGALPRGGKPRYAPKGDAGTHQRGPNDMTYKSGNAVTPSDSKFYRKKGGPGQRSGQ